VDAFRLKLWFPRPPEVSSSIESAMTTAEGSPQTTSAASDEGAGVSVEQNDTNVAP
jgi:hypothetical protein